MAEQMVHESECAADRGLMCCYMNGLQVRYFAAPLSLFGIFKVSWVNCCLFIQIYID